jgi:hypothetical protein
MKLGPIADLGRMSPRDYLKLSAMITATETIGPDFTPGRLGGAGQSKPDHQTQAPHHKVDSNSFRRTISVVTCSRIFGP